MRTKSLIALVLAFILCNGVFAQNYQIRITYNTNLRASYSTSSRIIETAPSGAVLHITGTQGRWLQVSKNGNQLWMAGWVGHTRVDNPPQAQPSNVDNCCFVDRQCNSDQEWTDGYWAFQNRQCVAPVQSLSQTPSQPVTTTSADVDNCCFIGWQCNNDEDWNRGYQAYQNNQCSIPSQATGSAVSHRPAIQGSARFVAQVNAALDALQGWTSQWYNYVLSGASVIVERNLFNYSASADVAQRTIKVGESMAFYRGNHYTQMYVLASVLVHEACHIHRFEAGHPGYRPSEGGEAGLNEEKACLTVQTGAFNQIDPSHSWLRTLNSLIIVLTMTIYIDRDGCWVGTVNRRSWDRQRHSQLPHMASSRHGTKARLVKNSFCQDAILTN